MYFTVVLCTLLIYLETMLFFSTINSIQYSKRKLSRQLAGNYLYSNLNWYLSTVVSFTAGSDLDSVQQNMLAFIKELQRLNMLHLVPCMVFILVLHVCVGPLK